MRYLNARNPAICWPLLPWFIEGNQTREEIFMELYGRLENDPDNTFVEIALDDELCKGILIGYISEGHVWIWQARASEDFEHSKKMLNDLMKWAKDKGTKELRARCSKDRNTNLIMRRFGFTKDGNEIVRKVS